MLPVVLALAGITSLACGGGATDKAKALLEAGDWGGARNVLAESLKGGGGTEEERGLLLLSLAAPDAARGGVDYWFLKACALEPSASSYLLAPSVDEQDKVDRLRNDTRRAFKDKGIDTTSGEDYGAVIRAAVRYGLTQHTWKPDQAMVQGAVGLCGLWLGEPTAEKALMASLGSQGAISKGADRYFAVAGDRIVDPLRASASNKDDVASGPAKDILQSLLEPVAMQTVLGSVEKPVSPRANVQARVAKEKVRAPTVSSEGVSISTATASSRVRGWFGLDTDASRARAAGWAGRTLVLHDRTVHFLWTWDEQAATGKLYGLTWMNSEWTRISFDGQDPLSAAGSLVLTVEATDEGDFVLEVTTGIGEQAQTVQTWAGPVVQRTRSFLIERRAYRLEGASASLVPVPVVAEAAAE